jgi:hypothetical protein
MPGFFNAVKICKEKQHLIVSLIFLIFHDQCGIGFESLE